MGIKYYMVSDEDGYVKPLVFSSLEKALAYLRPNLKAGGRMKIMRLSKRDAEYGIRNNEFKMGK